MSRLIDELNRAAKAAPQPMGFKAASATSPGPRITLIASLSPAGDRLAGDVDGADAVLLRLAKSDLAVKTLQKTTKSLPDIPWGAWLEDISAPKMETLVGAGADFLVFTASSRVLAAPQDDKTGKILQVDSSLGDGLVRAVNDLPLDAVLTTEVYEVDAIAWHHLMLFQRLANLLTKPLLVLVPLSMTADELQALWEAGVDGVVVEAGAEPKGRLRELRQAVDKFSPHSSRKRGRVEAILPRISSAPEAEPEEEEEEEE